MSAPATTAMSISSSGALLWMVGEGGARLPCRGAAAPRPAPAAAVPGSDAPAGLRRAVGPALRWPALAATADDALDGELAEALALAVATPPVLTA